MPPIFVLIIEKLSKIMKNKIYFYEVTPQSGYFTHQFREIQDLPGDLLPPEISGWLVTPDYPKLPNYYLSNLRLDENGCYPTDAKSDENGYYPSSVELDENGKEIILEGE